MILSDPALFIIVLRSSCLFHHHRFAEAAGVNRDWPQSRGVFMNADQTLVVSVNGEDHLRVVVNNQGFDLATAYTKICQVSCAQCALLEFALLVVSIHALT